MKCPFVIKVCTKCGKILVANESNFNKSKHGKYGLRADCRECRNKYKKKHYKDHKEEILEKMKEYREENKEKIKEYNKQYHENNKEEIKIRHKRYRDNNKEKRNEYSKQWYKKNKEHCKEYSEQYHKENKRHIKEKKKQWRKNNPEKCFNYTNKRRLLEENQGRGITKEQWYEMMEFFEWRCAYSGKYIGGDTTDRTIDYIVALNNNGEHEIWNLVPMYANYNCSKQDKNWIDWYIQQEFFDIDKLLKIYEWIEYAYNKYNE